jgi:hypothetical protein
MTKAQQDLLAAADLIERDGWCRKRMKRGKAHCALGALHALPGYDGEFWDACALLERFVGHDEIGRWNDAQPNGATVVAAMREAAK